MEKQSIYFEEIRKRLISVLIATGVGIIGGFFFSSKILMFCLKIFNFSGVNVTMTSPAQLINISIYIGILGGILMGAIVGGWQLGKFIKPAVSKKEWKTIEKILPIGIILFLAGLIFGAWVTQFVIMLYSKFSSDFNLNNIWDIQQFFSQVVMTAVLMGIVFQLPIVITGLIRLGVVKRAWLISKRRYVYALLTVFMVLLPPTDILSLILLIAPLLFLFEFALLLNIDFA